LAAVLTRGEEGRESRSEACLGGWALVMTHEDLQECPLENERLLEGYREGQTSVLATVYTMYSSLVRQQLRSLAWTHGRDDLAGASEVADLVQETFLRAFSSTARGRYDGRRPFQPYLAAIARNCFVDRVRERAREVLRDTEGLRELVESAPGAEDGRAEREDESTLPPQVLVTLPPALRGVYRERFVMERGQADAARALGITRAALRHAERKLIVELRRALNRRASRK